MKIHPLLYNRAQIDYQKEHHKEKGREWCEKCQVWFDTVYARRHRH